MLVPTCGAVPQYLQSLPPLARPAVSFQLEYIAAAPPVIHPIQYMPGGVPCLGSSSAHYWYHAGMASLPINGLRLNGEPAQTTVQHNGRWAHALHKGRPLLACLSSGAIKADRQGGLYLMHKSERGDGGCQSGEVAGADSGVNLGVHVQSF